MSEIDEIYAAIHDYTKERDDVLSFSRGDTFKLMEKADDRWWAVKNLRTEAVGYVPASYLSNAPSRQPDKPTSPPAAAAAMNRLESDIARFAERKAPPTEAPFAPPEPVGKLGAFLLSDVSIFRTTSFKLNRERFHIPRPHRKITRNCTRRFSSVTN
eukprot:m.14297 g.14297  ORF g.14297 m.14297 type:complete len:157 (+) comp25671_c0_seq2:66-536(+)